MQVPHPALLRFATDRLTASGMCPEFAKTVAETLLEGDLLGHGTHGLALLPRYLQELERGQMAREGKWTVTSRAASVAERWDGNWLPGPVLVKAAIDRCAALASRQGMGAVAIARSHHIACLAAYLQAVTQRGLAVIIASSSPSNRQVAPHGGITGVYSPNPIAAGWPTGGDPVLLDVSMSITTSGLVSAMAAEGRSMPGAWLVDKDGQATDDATVIGSGNGALLPVGGQDHGHKGFALGLLVEMLTTGLAGHGRAEGTDRWGASVFVLVLDPEHFGGLEAFNLQAGWIAAACRGASVIDGTPAVRLPGERALARREENLHNGVALAPDLLAVLQKMGFGSEEEVSK